LWNILNVKSFEDYISKEKLFEKKDKVLLAVSGGIDSVMMCELFHRHQFHFAIAHCNFKLRGEESDGDEDFVKKLAKKYKVPFFHTSFDTKKYTDAKKVSIQMGARELRYEWFEKIRSENNFDHIATAHHLNDSMETILINLVRGTGIAGLHGIAPKRDRIIRPLLFLKREQIEKFVKENKLKYREDSSNHSTKYLRNKIRKKIVPVLKELNPDIEQTFEELIQKAKQAETFIEKAIQDIKKNISTKKNNALHISIEKLKNTGSIDFVLFHLLKEYHFNETTLKDIRSSLDKQSGKRFFSATHQLNKDREDLIISAIEKNSEELFFIEEGKRKIETSKFTILTKEMDVELFKMNPDPAIAFLDAKKLVFPLQIRKWKPGDRFTPLGLKSDKKLSDFFTGEKLSIQQKENTFVILSGEEIVWIMGLRISERYKITKNTKTIYQLTLKNE
jgi:tRNA(Ile)-lysidine synthase